MDVDANGRRLEMGLLDELRRLAKSMSVEAFASAYQGYYLLGTIPASRTDDWSFVTDVRMLDGVPPGTTRRQAAAPAEQRLWRLEKSDRNTWRRQISVGRAGNNDVVIRHESVSKLHAHFQLGSMISQFLFGSADLLLSDVGTANGTVLEGRRLPAGENVKIKSGQRIRFGSVTCTVLDARDLHGALRALAG